MKTEKEGEEGKMSEKRRWGGERGEGREKRGQENERWQGREGMRGRNRMQVNTHKPSPPSELVAGH